MNAPTDAVVVAISEAGVESALSFAIGEARRTQRPVHLVSVVQLPAGKRYAGMRRELAHAATVALEKAQKGAEEFAGDDVAVSAEFVDARTVADGLVHHTTGASLLVLQHRALSRAHRLVAGSVAQGVAGRASVPVVSVPEGWTPREGAAPVVTVGVQDLTEAPALLGRAFAEAQARAASLVVLHAWWLATGYDVVVVDDAYRTQYAADKRTELEPILEPLRAQFPDVVVAVEIQHQPPVEAILDGAEKSDLLVLGRRHHLLPIGGHLGSIARAAIAHAACPVLINPELAISSAEIPYSAHLAAIGRPAETS